MINLKVWIDQLIEKILLENDHAHLGKLKWLLKFRKYISSSEEITDTKEPDKVIVNSDGTVVTIDNSQNSSAPQGSTPIKKTTTGKKKKFFARKDKSRGA